LVQPEVNTPGEVKKLITQKNMTTTKRYPYKRIILKLSGEALKGKNENNLSCNVIKEIAHDIKAIIRAKVQIGIVIGGGNFFRGARLNGYELSRITGDYLGMVATMLNALAMQDIFTQLQIPTTVMSALPIEGIIERYDCRRADQYLKEGFTVIFGGGTGNPLVTTDTALCLRGIELGADLLLKATNVDGVYAADPKKNSRAKFYSRLAYSEVLKKKLGVMDLAAFSLGSEHQKKLRIFNIHTKGALLRVVQGANEGTLIE
jgi:uridylate kinase